MASNIQLSTSTFYSKKTDRGKTCCRSVQNVKKRYRKQICTQIPEEFKSSLMGPSVTWKIFKRLKDAIDFSANYTKDTMVFSFEERASAGSGQRQFLVTHPKHMWLIHRSREPFDRCTYEVIKEGHPCKLYFDLEFSKPLNPEKNGITMTQNFMKHVFSSLNEHFGILCSESNVLWLDSSTSDKFSSHLIFLVNGIAFKDNYQAGIFVRLLISNISKSIDEMVSGKLTTPISVNEGIFVTNKNGHKVPFCDEGVYTKNRNFRLYLSSKLGKNSPLVLSAHNQYLCQVDDEDIFLDSLVTYFREKSPMRLLQVTANDYEMSCRSNNNIRSPSDEPKISGCNASPFPEVDAFVLDFVHDDLKIGFIRKWTLLNEGNIVYDIGNYRYCNNVGRHHRSNNIRIVADLKMGIFYQTCYDPECRAVNFKSDAHRLPKELCHVFDVDDDFFNPSSWEDILIYPEDEENNRLQGVTNIKNINNITDYNGYRSCSPDLYNLAFEEEIEMGKAANVAEGLTGS